MEGREHVIPQFLGTFKPETLCLLEVCDLCNNKFSKLETVFKEDSIEGFIAAQYQLRKDFSIRFRNDRLRFKTRIEGNQRIFDKLFPILDPQTGKVVPVPQIVIEGKNGKLQIIFLRGVRDSKKFADRIKWTGTQGASISVFANDQEEIKELIFELKKRGVNYKEIEKDHLNFADDGQLDIESNSRIDKTIMRVISKIAFNYFSFCAIKSGFADILYGDEFRDIRDFTLKGLGASPVQVTNYGLAIAGQEVRNQIPYHLIRITEQQGRIIAQISIFGHLRYVVNIAPYPFRTGNRGSFGLGHRFDLLNQNFAREDRARFVLGGANEFQLFANIAGIQGRVIRTL